MRKYQNIVRKDKLYSACYGNQFCVICSCIEAIVTYKSCGKTEHRQFTMNNSIVIAK